VCLSVRKDISGTTHATFTKLFVHVAYGRGLVTRSSSSVVVICYVLPVLWMTCFFSIVGHTGWAKKVGVFFV